MSSFSEKNNEDTREIPDQEQEFGPNDAVTRGMPASYSNDDEGQTFTLNELESDIDRGLSSSSSYENRSVAVAYNTEENHLSFVDSFSVGSHSKQYVDKGVASFSSASMDIIVPEPKMVPQPPFHLDTNTHSVPKQIANATKVYTMLTKACDDHQVDVLFKANQWLFVAKAYPNNELVNFRICLYDTPSNHYKLEFQLLDGDRLAYHSLLNLIKADLSLPVCQMFGYSNVTGTKDVVSEENVKQIVKMIDSKYVDVKIEGLKLAHKLICGNKTILPTFVKHSGIAAILTAIESERDMMEVQRCGASALNMYCKYDQNYECQALFKAPNGMKILKRLALMMPSSNYGGDTKFSSFFEEEDDDEDDQTHLEVQRQAASALLSIASRSSTVDHVTDIGGLQLFTELQNSGDVRLANIARDGLRYLSSSKQQTHY